jgi:hypothetical protein
MSLFRFVSAHAAGNIEILLRKSDRAREKTDRSNSGGTSLFAIRVSLHKLRRSRFPSFPSTPSRQGENRPPLTTGSQRATGNNFP